MKKIILILILILSFSGMYNSYSQNAFSDAVLIAKNSEDYINKIGMIINIGNLTARQKNDLQNLLTFLKDPWNQSIGKINFKIILEIKQILTGFDETVRKVNAEINFFTAELKKTEDEITRITNEINSKIQSGDTAVYELKIKKKESEDAKKNFEENIKQKKEVLDNIKTLRETQGIYDVFQTGAKNDTETLTSLGKDNEEAVAQTVSTSNFSLSQAAIIEAIGNAIIEQVKEGLVNSLFEGILDKDIDLKQNTVQSQLPEGTVFYVEDTIAYSGGNKSEKYSVVKPYYEYHGEYSFEDYVREQDSVLYKVSYDSGTVKLRVDNKVKLKNELRIFFPRTIQILEQLKEAKTNNYFTNLNITLKNSFNDDLKNILANITNEENTKKSKIFQKFFYDVSGERTDAYNYLLLAVALINNIKNGFHPIELIPIFEEFLLKSEKFKKYGTYIALIDLLQKNLRDVSQNAENIWVNVSSLSELNTDLIPTNIPDLPMRSSAEYFMAILYQTDHDHFEALKNFFTSSTGFNVDKFKEFKADLTSFIVVIRSVEKNVDELSKGTKSFTDYVRYLDNFITLLDTTNTLVSKYFFDTALVREYKGYITKFREYEDYTMRIYKSITNGTYSKILPVALEIFKDQYNEALNSEAFRNEVIRYTNLYVDLSTATTQAELNSAISKAAHNSGGYLRKSEEDFNLSIDSYPGIFVSNENINSSNGKFNTGFSVPLGINVQFKQFGIFLQAFELAAAVNYRWNNDSTTNLPSDVTFQQVFSPGAFFVFNPFRTFPLAINFGVSVTPALREINGSEITLNDSKSTFYGINFSYNVPLWYLY